MVFPNRIQAGERLAAILTHYRKRDDVLILGLLRGGVVVAFPIAEALQAPLDVFLVRKLGVPGMEELAMGAIASGNVLVKNLSVLSKLCIPAREFEAVVAQECQELQRQETVYRGQKAVPAISGRSVILVDDGLATGSTMQAAIEGVRRQQPTRIVVAVPVVAPAVYERLRWLVDDFVSLERPKAFGSVGKWYQDFHQTSDEEVRQLQEEASKWLVTGRTVV